MYIDIHVHNRYEDNDAVLLLNLFPGDTDRIGSPGYYSTGLHPWHVNQSSLAADIAAIHKAAAHLNVKAIGEIGLDKKIDVSYIEQLQAFEQQLAIADKFNKPVIIHCVKAYDDILSLRKKFNHSIPWIIHWFSASEQIAAELMKNNCYLSFGQMLFRENSKAYGVFKSISLKYVFFETDDTGISISQVYHKAAAIRNISPAELQEQIKTNFINCFGNIL
jgi:TatD DNase family protein